MTTSVVSSSADSASDPLSSVRGNYPTVRIFRIIIQSEILSHFTLKTHWRMNEIWGKFPEFSRGHIILPPFPTTLLLPTFPLPPITLPPFLLSLILYTPSFSAYVLLARVRSSSTWVFNVCLCVCSSSPFLDPWGVSTCDLGIFRICQKIC